MGLIHRFGDPHRMTGRRLIAAVAVTAALAATGLVSGAPAAPEPATLQALSVNAAQRLSGDLKLAVSGTLTCTKSAHFHLSLWALERTSGALAKGSIPGKLPLKVTPAVLQQRRARSLCSGIEQAWSVVLLSSGTHPVRFAAGPADVCFTVTVKKGTGYSDLQQSCSQVAVT